MCGHVELNLTSPNVYHINRSLDWATIIDFGYFSLHALNFYRLQFMLTIVTTTPGILLFILPLFLERIKK